MTMKIRKRLVVVFFFIVCLFVIISNNEIMRSMHIQILGYSNADNDMSCYKHFSSKDSFPKFEIEKEQIRLSSGKNIFFHETSCFSESGLIEINCRQACAVESAALMNPGMLVNLLLLSPSPPSNHTEKLFKYLIDYKNVKISRIFIDEYLRNTPLEQWYADGKVLESSQWPRSHMSDILRYLTLWRFGGIYLDLDVVIIKSLEDLSNFAGAEDWYDVAAGVIGFSAVGLGRRIANACLRDLMRNFRGNKWGNNGPGVITRTLQKFCAVKNAEDMTPNRCNGFIVFPPSAFYPIFYEDWMNYFSTKYINETMKLIESARAIHVWNKLSSMEVIHVGSKVPYAVIAQQYCPKIYNNCGSIF